MTSPRNNIYQKQQPLDEGQSSMRVRQDNSRATSNNTKITQNKHGMSPRRTNKWHSPLKSPTQPLSKSMIDPVHRMGTTGHILNMPSSVLPNALNVCSGDAQ